MNEFCMKMFFSLIVIEIKKFMNNFYQGKIIVENIDFTLHFYNYAFHTILYYTSSEEEASQTQ